jgi:hypothetical protein
MSVTVDDKPLAAEQLGLQTVGQLLAHIQQKQRRLVVHVLIDGQEPDLQRLGELKTAPLTGHTLYIETAEPRRMALEVLGEIEQHLSETDKLRTDCVSLLRTNNTIKALEKLRGCFSAWQHAQESVLKTAQLLRIDLTRITVDGRPFSEVLREFTAQLKLIKSALENRDFVSLIDTLVYETSETSDQWRAAIRSMRSVIGA